MTESIPVEDNPWARDLKVTDPDGNRMRVGTATESGHPGWSYRR